MNIPLKQSNRIFNRTIIQHALTMKKLYYIPVFVLLMVVGGVGEGWGQTWDGGGDGVNWNSANNWNPNGVPAAGADASAAVGFWAATVLGAPSRQRIDKVTMADVARNMSRLVAVHQ